jgi:hypothetical protein
MGTMAAGEGKYANLSPKFQHGIAMEHAGLRIRTTGGAADGHHGRHRSHTG